MAIKKVSRRSQKSTEKRLVINVVKWYKDNIKHSNKGKVKSR